MTYALFRKSDHEGESKYKKNDHVVYGWPLG